MQYINGSTGERHVMDPEVGTVIWEFVVPAEDRKVMAKEDEEYAKERARMNDDWMNYNIQL